MAGSGPEMSIGRTPYDAAGMSTGQYGFCLVRQFGQQPGTWLIDPVGKKFVGAPVSDSTRREMLRWFSGEASNASPFTSPQYEGDPVSRYLDS